MLQKLVKYILESHLKNIGHSIVKDVSKGATIIKGTAIKTGSNMAGKEAGEYLYNGLKEAGKSMPMVLTLTQAFLVIIQVLHSLRSINLEGFFQLLLLM
jgi:hypothetical protein